jgi:adenosylcobyric acid synthase
MLGERLADPRGIEGTAGTDAGLAYLDCETVLEPEKQLKRVSGTLTLENANATGYEIHAGVTRGVALEKPLVNLGERNDGAISNDGKIAGTYLHGIFDEAAARDALLRWAGLNVTEEFDYHARREADINRLADSIEENIDLSTIDKLIF